MKTLRIAILAALLSLPTAQAQITISPSSGQTAAQVQALIDAGNINVGSGDFDVTLDGSKSVFRGGQLFVGGPDTTSGVHTNLLAMIGQGQLSLIDWTPTAGSTTGYGLYVAPTIQLDHDGFTNVTGLAVSNLIADDGSARAVTNAYGARILTASKTADITITNAYGLWIDKPNIGQTVDQSLYVNGPSIIVHNDAAENLLRVALTGTQSSTAALQVTRDGHTSGLAAAASVTCHGAAGAGFAVGLQVEASGAASFNIALHGTGGDWQQDGTTDSEVSGNGGVGSINTMGGLFVKKRVVMAGPLITNPQELSGAGAVNVTTSATAFTSTGASQALTLADSVAGQIKTIVHVVDGGSGVLTPTTKSGYSTITFTNVGDSVTLQFFTSAGWCVIGSYGVVIAP